MGEKPKKLTQDNNSKAATNAAIRVCQKLTPKQAKFVKEYLANGYNATQAAIKAGYSKKTAFSIGTENLTKPLIKAAIKEQSSKEQAKFEYTKEEHFRELEELKSQAARTGALAAAVKAAELKGKLCGLYIERKEVAIKEPRRFVFEIKK